MKAATKGKVSETVILPLRYRLPWVGLIYTEIDEMMFELLAKEGQL